MTEAFGKPMAARTTLCPCGNTLHRHSKNLKHAPELKKRMVKTLVWSVVLYGSETWTMRQEDIKRLEAFEMWIWRRMERISWVERRTNEEILQLVGKRRSLMGTIRGRQKKWIGHILRSDTLLRDIIEGRMEGKRCGVDQEQCCWTGC